VSARRTFRLAIVGSSSLEGHPDALRVIRTMLDADLARHADLLVASGGVIGIDRMAAAEARLRGLHVIEHLPAGAAWPDYRERNERIAWAGTARSWCTSRIRARASTGLAGRAIAAASLAARPRSTRSPVGRTGLVAAAPRGRSDA
jgi:hypothetical protein